MAVKLSKATTLGIIVGFVSSLAAIAQLSCGAANKPSENQAKQAWLAGFGNILMTREQPSVLVTFKKTNGIPGEAFGVKTYEFEYEATLKCKGESYSTWTEPGECAPGQLVVNQGELHFKLTENGWVEERGH